MIKPFKVDISEENLQNIYSKVKNYQWHEMPDDGGWNYGTNLDYMKDFSKYFEIISQFRIGSMDCILNEICVESLEYFYFWWERTSGESGRADKGRTGGRI